MTVALLLAPGRMIMAADPRRPVLRLLLLSVVLLLGPLGACGVRAPSAGSSAIGQRPPGFTEPYPYTDGIEVEVTDVWTGRRLGVSVVELTVVVRNNTAHTFEALIRGDLRYGQYRWPAVRFLEGPGPDDSGSVQLVAVGGCSDPYALRFVLPPSHHGDLMFSVAIDAGAHDPAVFVGGL